MHDEFTIWYYPLGAPTKKVFSSEADCVSFVTALIINRVYFEFSHCTTNEN